MCTDAMVSVGTDAMVSMCTDALVSVCTFAMLSVCTFVMVFVCAYVIMSVCSYDCHNVRVCTFPMFSLHVHRTIYARITCLDCPESTFTLTGF